MKLVDIVVGPDAYRDLPRLVELVRGGGSGGAAQQEVGKDNKHPGAVAASSTTGTPAEQELDQEQQEQELGSAERASVQLSVEET